jgi:hypothetical protein
MTAEVPANVILSLLGLVLIWWAKPLSVRYNTWTTRLRERHPSFNPPPTPEWRERNTKIMTGLFRFFRRNVPGSSGAWAAWKTALMKFE